MKQRLVLSMVKLNNIINKYGIAISGLVLENGKINVKKRYRKAKKEKLLQKAF